MQTKKGERIDLSGILDSCHENKWIAIASDYSHVIATADSLRDLFSSVSDATAIFCKLLPHDVSLVPSPTRVTDIAYG
jgi:hypothetical protein